MSIFLLRDLIPTYFISVMYAMISKLKQKSQSLKTKNDSTHTMFTLKIMTRLMITTEQTKKHVIIIIIYHIDS